MKFVKLPVLVMVIVGHAAGTGGGTANYGSSSVNYGTGGTSSTSFGGGSSVNYGGSNSFTSSGFSKTTSSRGSSGGSSFASPGFSGSTSSAGFLVGSTGGFGQNEPYNFDYQSADEQGNTYYHSEEADASGTVRGSYGYTDIQGLYRVVDYIADASGFRASIRTNEPGTDGKESPADVQMTVEEPPAGIRDGYTTFSGFRGAGGSTSYGSSVTYSNAVQLLTSGDESSGTDGNASPYTGVGGGVRSGKSG